MAVSTIHWLFLHMMPRYQCSQQLILLLDFEWDHISGFLEEKEEEMHHPKISFK